MYAVTTTTTTTTTTHIFCSGKLASFLWSLQVKLDTQRYVQVPFKDMGMARELDLIPPQKKIELYFLVFTLFSCPVLAGIVIVNFAVIAICYGYVITVV